METVIVTELCDHLWIGVQQVPQTLDVAVRAAETLRDDAKRAYCDLDFASAKRVASNREPSATSHPFTDTKQVLI
jgi:hypothetical protein